MPELVVLPVLRSRMRVSAGGMDPFYKRYVDCGNRLVELRNLESALELSLNLLWLQYERHATWAAPSDRLSALHRAERARLDVVRGAYRTVRAEFSSLSQELARRLASSPSP